MGRSCYVGSQCDTQDSVTGDIRDLKEVEEGCDEELGFMERMWFGTESCGVKP